MDINIIATYLKQLPEINSSDIKLHKSMLTIKNFPYAGIIFGIVVSGGSFLRITFKDEEKYTREELVRIFEIIDHRPFAYTPCFKNETLSNTFTTKHLYIKYIANFKHTEERYFSRFKEVNEILKSKLAGLEINDDLEPIERELISKSTYDQPLIEVPVEGNDFLVQISSEKEKALIQLGKDAETYLFSKVLSVNYGGNLKWLNENEESYADHDFEVLEGPEKIKFYIECKGTRYPNNQFYISKNEWNLILQQNDIYHLYFVIFKETGQVPIVHKISNIKEAIFEGTIVPYHSTKDISLQKETICFSYIR